MTSEQATRLETILTEQHKEEYEFCYRKTVLATPPTELLPGDRCDVSWISTESPDRCKEVVIAKGMDDSHYKLNPIVTMQHCYYMQPVGRSLWRKVTKDGDTKGIKAKTHYPPKPTEWRPDEEWSPDTTLMLIQSGLLTGKSIGFLPLAVHYPSKEERDKNHWAESEVTLVIDKWLLLEYACTYLPMQQEAIVEAVSKSAVKPSGQLLKALGIAPEEIETPKVSRATPLASIELALMRRLDSLNVKSLAEKIANETIDRVKGRI